MHLYPHNSDWNEQLKIENNTNTTEMIYKDMSNEYTLRLRTVKYIANKSKVVAYELITNQPINKQGQENHPFQYIEAIDMNRFEKHNYVISGINADNIVMDALFQLIMLDDSVLSKNSGLTDVKSYRARLIKQLNDLWD